MEEFVEFSSEITEFIGSQDNSVNKQLVNSCVGTDPLPPSKESSMQTNLKLSTETQTAYASTSVQTTNDKKLAQWLRKIYPFVETELKAGTTPVVEEDLLNDCHEELTCRPYQKLKIPCTENAQGHAIWLSVHTNNAPVLVATASVVHEDWCAHVDQSLTVFCPQRTSSNFVVFEEWKTIPVKACVKCLCTNPFDKDMFAAGTVTGDLYVWKYETGKHSNEADIREMICESSEDTPVVLDWLCKDMLVTAFANGTVVLWKVGPRLSKERQFKITEKGNSNTKLTTLLALSRNEIVVGTEDGSIFLCSNLSVHTSPLLIELKSHKFAISSLLKAFKGNKLSLVSCDLSGELFIHEWVLGNIEDEPKRVLQIPLPFKNAIACSRDGEIIFCPGTDGALDIYRVKNGSHSPVKGALHGKADFIKSNEYGSWIVTGIHGEYLQIYKVDFD